MMGKPRMIALIGSERTFRVSFMALVSTLLIAMMGFSDTTSADEILDARVQQFLEEHVRDWRDMNVPYQDGKILHDIIIDRGFTRAFEIGTSPSPSRPRFSLPRSA